MISTRCIVALSTLTQRGLVHSLGGDFMDPLMSSCQQQRGGSALLCFILDVLKKEKNIHHGGPSNTALW
jgi:hypothetical protein